jgi:uncharacterized protein YybS (DUF2232 family)
LAIGLAGVWTFVFLIAPALRNISPVREVLDSVRQSGIDAGALFYTEADESAEAEFALRHALKAADED